ncbi:MAG: shikimate kinase [Myxococcota bacterium]
MAGSERSDRCVLLTGPMGAGKSRVGRALAARLGWKFVDTDVLVEKAAGMKIAEIFAREGEAGFRKRERAVLEVLPTGGCVIALGGGAVVSQENREVLREKGTLMWLDARPETLAERIGEAAQRPLLAGLDREARIAKLRALRESREAAYGTAEHRIETDARGVDEVCAAVLAALGAGAAS